MAWSSFGHQSLSKHTLEHFSKEQRYYFEGLAEELSLDKGFDEFSSWPDKIRNEKLAALFASFNVDVPGRLKPFARYTTNDWHYSNHYIFESNEHAQRCQMKKRGRLLDKLLALHEVIYEHASGTAPLDKTQEAIVWSLFLHLFQDFHQPLHLLSNVNQECQSDLGGNRSCMNIRDFYLSHSKDKCRRNNLHYIWDQGFGIFQKSLLSPADEQGLRYSFEDFAKQLRAWTEETKELHRAIYSLNGDRNFEEYEQKSARVAQRQSSLAVARSLVYIDNFFHLASSKNVITKTESVGGGSMKIWQSIKRFLENFL